METLIADVNWVAVVVGAAVAFILGWLWYSEKLFGTKWRAGIKLDPNDQSSMVPAMVAQAVGTFLLSWVIGVAMAAHSLALAVLIAFTISVLMKAGGLFTQKSTYAIAVDSGYVMVMAALMIGTHLIF